MLIELEALDEIRKDQKSLEGWTLGQLLERTVAGHSAGFEVLTLAAADVTAILCNPSASQLTIRSSNDPDRGCPPHSGNTLTTAALAKARLCANQAMRCLAVRPSALPRMPAKGELPSSSVPTRRHRQLINAISRDAGIRQSR